MKPTPHHRRRWLLLSLLFLLVFVLNISVGSVSIPVSELLKSLLPFLGPSEEIHSTIVWAYRLPKASTAILAGSGLSVCGLLMQRLFQNSLAGPFVLGISSGASLGAALFFMGAGGAGLLLSELPLLSELTLVTCCVLGGLAVLLLIAWASIWIKDVQSLLIVGLMTGSLGSALISVLAYFSKAEELQRYAFWSFGSLGSLHWEDVGVLALIWLLGTVFITFRIKGLNALLAGNDYLVPLGISLKQLKWSIIAITALITGGLTAYVGPIAFVGLAVPHISRMLFTEVNHRVQLPATLMLGAILMLLCDSIAQVPGSPIVLPINAITSLFGAPVVIWLIVQRRRIRL